MFSNILVAPSSSNRSKNVASCSFVGCSAPRAFSPSKTFSKEKRTRQLAVKWMDDIAELCTDSKEDVFVEIGVKCVNI